MNREEASDFMRTVPEFAGLAPHERCKEIIQEIEQEIEQEIFKSEGAKVRSLGRKSLEPALAGLLTWSQRNGDSVALTWVLERIVDPLLGPASWRSKSVPSDEARRILAGLLANCLLKIQCNGASAAQYGQQALALAKDATADFAHTASEAEASVAHLRDDFIDADVFRSLIVHLVSETSGAAEWGSPDWKFDRNKKVSQKAIDEGARWLQMQSSKSISDLTTHEALYALLSPIARGGAAKQMEGHSDVDWVANQAMNEFLDLWPDECLKAWSSASKLLRTIAWRRAIDHVRKNRVKHTSDLLQQEDSGPAPPDLLALLEECVESNVSPEMRKWFDAHFRDRKSWVEIAKAEGMKAAALRQRVATAYGKLMTCMEKKTRDER